MNDFNGLPPNISAKLAAALAHCPPDEAEALVEKWQAKFAQKKKQRAEMQICVLEAIVLLFPQRAQSLIRAVVSLCAAAAVLWFISLMQRAVLAIGTGPPGIASANPTAVFETSLGRFEAEIFEERMVCQLTAVCYRQPLNAH